MDYLEWLATLATKKEEQTAQREAATAVCEADRRRRGAQAVMSDHRSKAEDSDSGCNYFKLGSSLFESLDDIEEEDTDKPHTSRTQWDRSPVTRRRSRRNSTFYWPTLKYSRHAQKEASCISKSKSRRGREWRSQD